ncbi:MAG: preprotein translocase subunit SecE [Chloroflexi bacterium]|nr:preprotein translocase subunit SecE [Chloroflexota bacterium]
MSTQSKRTAVARGWPRFQFVRDVIAELKKVTWPTRREASYLTLMVLVVALVVGLILGTVDFGFSKIVKTLFLR